MNIFQARRLGFSLRNATAIGRELKEQGIITEDSTRKEVAEAIAFSLAGANQDEAKRICAEAGFDWNKLIELLTLFIEKILPLILPFIL